MRPGGPEALVGIVVAGRYRIERVVGEGGMGAVYQAEHVLMRKRFALKVLHPEMGRLPEVVARFEREAMARISSSRTAEALAAGMHESAKL